MLFDVDLAFEVCGVHFHELMGVARVAVFTGKFAAAIRIDHPGKGHARRIAAREDAAVLDRDIVDFMAFGQRLAFCRETCDSNQPSFRGTLWEERIHGKPTMIRILFALRRKSKYKWETQGLWAFRWSLTLPVEEGGQLPDQPARAGGQFPVLSAAQGRRRPATG